MCVQQQVTHITQCFHLLIFPCLVKRMVITLIMTEKNFKKKKIVKFTQFCNLCKTNQIGKKMTKQWTAVTSSLIR